MGDWLKNKVFFIKWTYHFGFTGFWKAPKNETKDHPVVRNRLIRELQERGTKLANQDDSTPSGEEDK